MPRIPVELIDCRFDEPVELDHATVRAADFASCRMPALHADGLQTEADLTLTRLSSGRISLFKAQISGNLWLNDARVHPGEAGLAVHGAQLRVDGGLYANSTRRFEPPAYMSAAAWC
jgi:hypothetical protein